MTSEPVFPAAPRQPVCLLGVDWRSIRQGIGSQECPKVAGPLHLAGVRDPEALAKLPDEEAEAWRVLWTEVRALLQKTR